MHSAEDRDSASLNDHSKDSEAAPRPVCRPSWTSRLGRPPGRRRYPCLGTGVTAMPSDLQTILPAGYTHHLCSYRPLPNGFVATVRVDFGSAAAARRWLQAFQESSLTTFRSRRTFPRPGARLLYKAWFRCQRNQLGRAASGDGARHTACPAALAITVAQPTDTRPRSRADPHLPHLPGSVEIKHVHNHSVRSAADLRFRDVSPAVQAALVSLFERGYAPAAALRALRHQLMLQLGESYAMASADRAVLPSLSDVCRIHRRHLNRTADDAQYVEVIVQAESDDAGGDCDDEDDPGVSMVLDWGDNGVVENIDSGDPGHTGMETQPVCGTERVQCNGSRVVSSHSPVLETCTVEEAPPKDGDSVCSVSFAEMLTPRHSVSLNAVKPGSSVEEDADKLQRHIEAYNSALGGAGAAAMARGAGGEFAAALTTPLMRRIHRQLPQAGEVVFVEFAGRVERRGCPLWLLVCASEAGALPLGLLLASSPSAFPLALRCWHHTLPEDAFCGRGAAGPQVLVTDDEPAQRAALATQYPAALTLLCAFRLLQAVWRWLRRRRLPAEDASHLLLLARRLLRARSVPELERAHSHAGTDPVLARHPEFRRQFSSIYEHRHLWAAWYAEEDGGEDSVAAQPPPPRHEASFFAIAAEILCDRFIFMAAEYRPAEAFDFVARRADPYYVSRVEWSLGGGGSLVGLPRYLPPPAGLQLRVRRVSPLEHEVTPEPAGEPHSVHLWLSCCSCRDGRAGAPCVHRSAVLAAEPRPTPTAVPAAACERLRRLVSELPLYDASPPPVTQAWLDAAAGMSGPTVIEEAAAETEAEDGIAEVGDCVELSATDYGGQISGDEHTDTNARGLSDGASSHFVLAADPSRQATADGSPTSEADAGDDPEEVAMTEVICDLQAVTADLTGRLAADPAAYVPLVRRLVSRYWQLAREEALLDGLPEVLTQGLAPGTEEPETEVGMNSSVPTQRCSVPTKR